MGSALTSGLLIVATACGTGPRDVRLGLDECAHCRMSVDDLRFAGQLVSRTGQTWTFDSIECLAAFVAGPDAPGPDAVRSVWVMSFDEPGAWLSADQADFLHSDGIRSPMGVGLAAFRSASRAEGAQTAFGGGEVLDWDGVRRVVARDWAGGTMHAH